MNPYDEDPTILSPRHTLLLVLLPIVFVRFFAGFLTVVGGKSLGLLSEFLTIIPALLYVHNKQIPLRTIFRLHKISVKLLVHAVVISLAVFVLADALDRFIMNIFPMPEEWMNSIKNLVQIRTWWDALILLVAAVFIAGFVEEMLFRGLMQRSLEHHREPATAIVLTAVLFAIVHFSPWTSLQILFLGLFLGYLAWKSNSIYPAIILHAMNNLLSILLLNLPAEKVAWYGTATHVNYTWVVLALLVLVPTLVSFSKECSFLRP